MHGNSFALGNSMGNSMANGASTHNGPGGKPQGSASIWDFMEPGLPA